MIVGKTISEALGISATDLDRELEGLPELKNRQPVLILIALDNAARKLRGLPLRDRMSPGEEALCTCFEVPESIIERAVRLRGLKTVDEITAATKAGGGCHTCHPELEEILARCEKRQYKFHIPAEAYDAAHRLYGTELPSSGELAHNPPEKQSRIAPDGFVYPDKSPVAALVANTTKPRQKVARRPWNEMTYAERVQRIQDVIEYDLRPAIRTDGGDVKLVDVKDNRVLVTLHGHCKTCHSALSTLKMGVEKRLQDAVWPELEVEEIFIED
jgi:NifU-like protein